MRAWKKDSVFGPGDRLRMAEDDRQVFRAKLNLARTARQISIAAREVGRVLVGMLGADGRLEPSHQTIAERAGCSPRTVQRCLDQLRALGFLSWQRRITRSAATAWEVRQTSNAYVLLLPASNGQNGEGVPIGFRRKRARGEKRQETGVRPLSVAQQLAALGPVTAAHTALIAARQAARAAAVHVRNTGVSFRTLGAPVPGARDAPH